MHTLLDSLIPGKSVISTHLSTGHGNVLIMGFVDGTNLRTLGSGPSPVIPHL
jgi:hypothetical protein